MEQVAVGAVHLDSGAARVDGAAVGGGEVADVCRLSSAVISRGVTGSCMRVGEQIALGCGQALRLEECESLQPGVD
ncbi:hypothetical protein ACFVUW_26225, partial [Streptomyces xiamenensis]|uniref:hypothetical protein n=1 Tax=Streptomyces xiamenensis TaxID=408015 RepID=UPI0036E9B55B